MAFIKFVRANDKEEILVNSNLIQAVERDIGKNAEKQSRIVFRDGANVAVVGHLTQIAGWLGSA